MLDVNDFARINGTIVPSDSMLKTNISSFTSGLDVIRQISPKTYNYNGKGGFETQNQYVGVIAENIAKVAPYAVRSSFQKLDSGDANATQILNVYNEAVMYTSLNAIKQLDSTVTKATSVPNAPVLISPANGTVGSFNGEGALSGNQQQISQQPALVWHSVSQGIIIYHAQIAKDNAFTNLAFDQSTSDTTISFSVCDSLTTTYYWRVNAKNNAGDGAFSQVFSFTDTAKCFRFGIIRGADATGFNSSSDARLKTNVAPVTSALDKVNALNGIYYNWIPTSGYQFDSTQQIGFIAQDVQQIVPQVVHTDVNGNLTLDYGRLVPVLVQAIKEQQAQITALQGGGSRTNGSGSNTLPSSDAEIASASAVLWQNFPNPFGDGTVIRYFVPEKTESASIIFTDEFGNEVKTVSLPYKGAKAELNLSTSNLASGIYSYSLIVDGKIMDTKKMLKSK